MEGSTRASDASVIPPQSIQIPQNTSEADNTRTNKGSNKPMVQYVVGLAPIKSDPSITSMNTEPTASQLATAKSILDQLGVAHMGANQTQPMDQGAAQEGQEGEKKPNKPPRKKKEKAEVEYTTCDLCGVILNSDAIAQTHFAGKKHQKKLKAETILKDLMAKADIINSPNKRTVVVPPISQQGSLPTQTTAEAMDAQWSGEASGSRTVVVPSAEGEVANGASANILKCEVCDIDFNSPSHADMHYQGKKHAKKVKLMLEGPTPQPAPKPKKTKEAVEASELFCTLCNVSTTGQIK
ncbi:uncharacterized protein [Amphiura filiformis]|uniref:uncharacterized protein isoform X1 n=1 Tax=Amphiura filiformis TaxID=82378 RepID=UPI003B212F3E